MLSLLLDIKIIFDNFGLDINLLNCLIIFSNLFLAFYSIFDFSFVSDFILSDKNKLFFILLNISEYFSLFL